MEMSSRSHQDAAVQCCSQCWSWNRRQENHSKIFTDSTFWRILRKKATMEPNKSLLHLFLFFLVVGMASSSHISNGALEPHRSLTGRTLLQQKSTCSVDFENMNYTVITSQCKGPNYAAERCCPPLKQLLCPVKDQFNDLKSNCADVFFSYVNLYGKYPPGLFAALCKEGQHGLDCTGVAITSQQKSDAATHGYSCLLMVFAALALLL